MNWFTGLSKKTNPELIITVIGIIISIIFGIYTLLERKPNITFDITGQTNILDVKKPLKGLDISFEGNDIQKNRLNLCIYTIKVENTGQTDILQNQYDQNDIFGLQMINAKIIEARLTDSNDPYIKESQHPHIVSNNSIQFSKNIFERNKYFVIELLVIHNKGQAPEINPLGKIAGMNKIQVRKIWLKQNKEDFWIELIKGNLLIQALRMVVYTILFFIVFIVISRIVLFFSGWVDKQKSKIHKQETTLIKKEYNMDDTEERDAAFNYYIDNGPKSIFKVKHLLDNQEKLDTEYKIFIQAKALQDSIEKFEDLSSMNFLLNNDNFLSGIIYGSILAPFIKKDLIRTEGNESTVLVNVKFKDTINNIYEYLSKQGKLKRLLNISPIAQK